MRTHRPDTPRRALAAASTAMTVLVLSACWGGSDPDTADAPPGLPEGHPSIATAAAGLATTRVVKETMDGGGYTYALLTSGDEEIWVAGPVTELAVGDTIVLSGAMNMGSFTSAAMDRTFDPLWFTDAFRRSEGASAARRGTVVTAVPAAGYTYLEVDAGDENPIWLAAPEMTVAEGDAVAWSGGSVMRDFASRTLGRSFAEITFVNRVDVLPGS